MEPTEPEVVLPEEEGVDELPVELEGLEEETDDDQ